VVVIAGAAFGVRALVSGGAGSASTATTVPAATAQLQREVDRRLALPSGSSVPTPVAADALQAGITGLLGLPAIDLSYTADGTQDGRVTATGTVVPGNRSFELRRATSLEGGAAVTDERRVVNGTVYVRVIDQAGPGISAPWDSAPVSAEPEQDFDGVFTADGTAMGHLVDLAALVRGAGFTATRMPGSAQRYQLRVPAEKIAQYYIAQGNPLAQPMPANSTSVVEFTVRPDHVLTDLSAYGAVFEDGEPIEPAVIDIQYRPAPPAVIVAPAPSELRH
jgi:hypothetical protein